MEADAAELDVAVDARAGGGVAPAGVDAPVGLGVMALASRRRPLVFAAMFFIIGIFAHQSAFGSMTAELGIAAFCVATALIFHQRRIIAEPALALSLFLAGHNGARVEHYYFPADDIAHFTADAPTLARVRVRIDQPPRVLRNEFATGRRLPPRQVAQGRVEGIETRAGWREASGRLLLQIQNPHEKLTLGQRVEVFGMLHRPMAAMNPGEFDWAGYYREQRIVSSMQVAHRENIRILDDSGPGLLGYLRQKSRAALEAGFSKEQAIDHALLRALVLGDSDPMLRDVQDEFIKTGTSHHLAISGMHIAVVWGVVYMICRSLRLRPRLAVSIGLGVILFYGLVALPSPPVTRSVILCVAFSVGLIGRRSLDGLQLLAASVLLMLIYHPLDLYNAGFELSFGTVMGLMLFVRPTVALLDSLRDRDVLIARSVRPPPVMVAGTYLAGRGLRDALITGVVAWLVSAPLIAYHFYQINPYSAVASLLLAIPVFVALVGGVLKIILTLLFPWGAGFFAFVSAIPIGVMRRMAEWMAHWPGTDVAARRPPVVLIIAAYGLLALPLLPWGKGRVRWLLRAGPVGALLLLFLTPFLPLREPWVPPAGQFRLTLLSVGAGQCAVLHLPSGGTVLVDAGSDTIADLYRRTLLPYLKSTGRARIETIFVSHANHDHFSAVADLADDAREVGICLTPYFERDSADSVSARAMLEVLRRNGTKRAVLSAGQVLALDEKTTVQVLWPPPDRELSANDSCLVLRLKTGGRTILFTGDIQETAQRQLLLDPTQLQADILIAPHHGSSESTTAEFLAAVNPKIILSSNDSTLTGKQRMFDKLAGGREVHRTHRSGAVGVDIGADGRMGVRTFRAGGESRKGE